MRRSLASTIVVLWLMSLASHAAGQAVPALAACERAHERPPGAPVDVELATVTDTEFVVTWLTCEDGRPAPADSTVRYQVPYGPSGSVIENHDTAFHNVRVSGLTAGETYTYTVSSNGISAAPDRLNPGAFTTLEPPAGDKLFEVAVLADVHIGETTSGLATSQPVPFPPAYGSKEPYPLRMAEAAVEEINKEKASLTILPADNSSHGQLDELQEARAILDRLEGDYVIARGSHDRPNQEDASTDCPPDGDCFRQVFRPDVAPSDEPQHLPQAVPHRRWLFVALDSANLATGTGELSDDQLAWLQEQLEKAKAREWPAIIFFHHPVAEYSSTAAVPPAIFGVRQDDAQQLLDLIGDYDVRLVVNSHTHRNWIAYSPHTGRMPIIEAGPSKEYPGGYSLISVYEGGLMRTWFPTDCDFCNEWRETTRGEYFSLYPLYVTGSLRDRSFVHLFDAPDTPGIPSLPLGIWPSIGPRPA